MIETAHAVRYDGMVEQGRTAPLRVHAEKADGASVDVILKVTDGHHLTIEGLANEMMDSLLAGDLGLPTPQPLFVEVSPEFIASIPDMGVQARLNDACNLCFGSTDAGSQWRRWDPTDRLSPDRYGLALRVLAFDSFIGNPDRGARNSNLLRHKSDGALLLIDHETAFGFRMKRFPPVRPWVLGNLSHLAVRGADSEHLFFTALSGRADLAFDAVSTDWNDLSDVRLAAYDAVLPAAWEAARPMVLEALGHLRTVRDRLPDCLNELRRVLQ